MMGDKVSQAPADSGTGAPPAPSRRPLAPGEVIEAGDTVLHRPSQENWWLIGVDTPGGRVCAGGWPPTMGKLSDCELAGKGTAPTNEDRRYRQRTFGFGWDDDRADEARMDREWAL